MDRRHSFFFLSINVTNAFAAENRLGTSTTITQDHDDNYLMSPSNRQSLSGLYVKPKIQYQHTDGVQSWDANIQESVEQYNRSEYDVENPGYGVSFQQKLQRGTFNIGFDAIKQSTRVSEFTDAGNFSNATTQQHIQSLTSKWEYQLSPRYSIVIGGDMQTTDYNNRSYADLSNDSVQATLQILLSETASAYVGLLMTQYQTNFSGFFPVEPQLLSGFLLCPPNSALLSPTACSAVQQGDGTNETTSPGIQTGFNWSINPQLKLGVGAGFTHIETKQTRLLPEASVQLGPPFEQNIIFGGESSIRSQSSLSTLKIELGYEMVTTFVDLAISRQVQPSSSGSLLQTDMIDFSIKKSLSEISWMHWDVRYETFVTLDDEIGRVLLVDRNILQSALNYNQQVSKAWQTTASVGYKKQENRDLDVGLAHAFLVNLSATYTPRELVW